VESRKQRSLKEKLGHRGGGGHPSIFLPKSFFFFGVSPRNPEWTNKKWRGKKPGVGKEGLSKQEPGTRGGGVHPSLYFLESYFISAISAEDSEWTNKEWMETNRWLDSRIAEEKGI